MGVWAGASRPHSRRLRHDMVADRGEPTLLKHYTPRTRSLAYPWLGLLLGAGFAVLIGYPLHLAVSNFHDHLISGAPLRLLKAIVRGFTPRLWPLFLLYAVAGGLAGAVLGRILQRLRDNRLRFDNLHHEFELQVTTLRHHYKNLALGIQGFSSRIKRKMTSLEEHFRSCARDDCATYGQFYQDFDALQQSVGILEDASQRLTHTLEQELLFLKALTGDSLAAGPRDLYPFLVHCVQDLLGLRFREKPIRVEINGRPLEDTHGSLIFPFDPTIIEVILQNILTNAMKSGDHLQIRVRSSDPNIWVEVEDNGAGMDLVELKRQLKAAGRRGDSESTHLGLKVSVHLLEKCQGRLWVSSQPGAGALFIIELPKWPRGCNKREPGRINGDGPGA